jgi:hypothetical protein
MVDAAPSHVHVRKAGDGICHSFPQRRTALLSHAKGNGHHNCGMTWAQTATVPTNRRMDVRAAASSTNVFNISTSLNNRQWPVDSTGT